jgi:hypothetical protein
MQEWFRRSSPGVSPYRLYALSNVGSLLALVSYPLLFETFFTRQEQARFWSWGLVAYAAACVWCARRVWRLSGAERPAESAPGAEDSPAPTPGWSDRLLWIALPASASVLLLAVTNKMCQDVAVIPFLWVLPLAIYLLTFIIAFDSPRWYSTFYYTIALAGALAAACVALHEGADMDILRQIAIYSVLLFTGCMVCHGELYRLRPHPRHLTSFYLMISAGDRRPVRRARGAGHFRQLPRDAPRLPADGRAVDRRCPARTRRDDGGILAAAGGDPGAGGRVGAAAGGGGKRTLAEGGGVAGRRGFL